MEAGDNIVTFVIASDWHESIDTEPESATNLQPPTSGEGTTTAAEGGVVTIIVLDSVQSEQRQLFWKLSVTVLVPGDERGE